MPETAEEDAAKLKEVTEILDRDVLALGRDALRWLDKIRKMHQQIIENIVAHKDIQYHAAISVGNDFKAIKTATNELQGKVTDLKDWDIQKQGYPSHEFTAECLYHVEQICTNFVAVKKVLQALLAALKVMEAGVMKELEDDAYVAKMLAGFEALLWKIDDKLPQHPAHAAVKTLIRKTTGEERRKISGVRYTERKEHHMHRRLNRAIKNIREVIAKIENDILPKISGDMFDTLEDGAANIKVFVQDSTRHGFINNLEGIFRIYLMAGRMLSSPSLHAAISNVAEKYKDIVSIMDGLKTEIDRLEAREGALEQQEETVIADLKAGIAALEKKGILPKAA
jgi:hypothetical protein